MVKISVCVIGSGNWGTTVAKKIAENVEVMPELDKIIKIFVYDELFDGKHINEVLNSYHVNPEYVQKLQLPPNVVAHTDLVATARYADVIIFAVPQNYIEGFCKTILGKINPSATALSLVRGFTPAAGGGIELVSDTVMNMLQIPCSSLIGVNLASEVTLNRYCEVTVGCRDLKYSKLFQDLFTAKNFRTTISEDADCVEVLAYIKHLVAFAYGILDGMETNENTKSACIRFCLNETIRFLDIFYPGSKLSTLFESCGIADMLTVCYASKNRRLAQIFATSDKTIEELENRYYGGEQLLGPLTAKEVNYMLQHKGLQHKFPIFTMVHKICQKEAKPEDLVNTIITIPNIIYHPTHLVSV